MYDVNKMMEDAIEQYKETMKEQLESQLALQQRMSEENGWEVTDADRQELIDDNRRQMEEYEAMMRQQIEIQTAMMGSMDGLQEAVAAQQEQLANMMPGMMQYDEDAMEAAWQEFLVANKVPDVYEKYMPIGALLIGTQEEPYETLALIMDEDDTDAILSGGWGIDSREEALEMLASLLEGRHATKFAKSFAKAKAGNFDELDEEDAEDYQTTVAALNEVLYIPIDTIEACDTLIAWDLERIGYLVRLFVNIGYITEDEAWEWMAKAAVKIKETFTSWEDYIVSILLGRGFAMGVHQEPFAIAYDLLVENEDFLKAHPIANLA